MTKKPARRPAPLCPICGKNPPTHDMRPFCSKHCADVDLGRWFGGRYGVASEDQEGAAEATLQEISRRFPTS
ncbi:DNA gyrase inhibitor YacG [Oecophyllibacter saccharovorans]|uniref:DNA gyrase inhibitor YacG n=1 Tax=Oecophyllibacter saccharovorans TaxID=2558360 RepID=A0A506UKW1_9PROT|nr:DNA gyrase inhibitor YacG [Oecophyllibacter saccharovorans]TPW33680.1 DNA gyrase inhibitor YacG [Oecophyllibacter saccharovorans]TPW33960.1 DNA gyrase inhibitor YacG [Oecophyllibacter saccharovorans]